MVDEIGKAFYTISAEAAFVNPPAVLRGKVVQYENIQSANIADIKKILKGVNFSYRTTLGFILKPIDGVNEAGITIKVGQTGKPLLLPPLLGGSKTYHWKLVRIDDCTGEDLAVSCQGPNPSVPDDGKCDLAMAGLTSVCWQNGANPGYPGGPIGEPCRHKPPQGNAAPDWCTYKNVKVGSCKLGANPGKMWTCVYE